VPGKTYDQYCGIAAALDRVGDRWTLLVMRELSFGEQRFTDLKSRLPGIASNLLTERLRALEDDGLVEQRELPAPAARSVYALTDEGRRVVPVLRALSTFGQPFLGEPPADGVRPEMAVYSGLGSRVDLAAAIGVRVAARFLVDGQELWLRVDDGRLERGDAGAAPDLEVTGSSVALLRWVRGESRADLVGLLEVTGSDADVATFARIFHLHD
jgi:DNA-binding HxlR family transcriptional regulator